MPSAVLRTLVPFVGVLLPVCAAWAQTPPSPVPEGRPLWEAGVALIGVNGPDYPAAATRGWRGAPVPIFIYRGPWLKVDDEGARSRLLQTGNLRIDFSGAAGFDARSNGARAGMPDLDYLLQIGPQAVYKLPLDSRRDVSAHLKVRAVVSTDGRHTNGRGMVVEQEFRWTRRGWPDASSQVLAGAQFLWGSEKLHDYFYQVDPAYATAARPAYDAKAGYFGSTLRAGFVRRLTPTLSATAGASVNFHAGAANENSPLFQKRTTAGVLVALIWTPWQSDARAAAEP